MNAIEMQRAARFLISNRHPELAGIVDPVELADRAFALAIRQHAEVTEHWARKADYDRAVNERLTELAYRAQSEALAQRIALAPSQAHLNALLGDLRALPEHERAALRPAYARRLAELEPRGGVPPPA